MNDLIQLECKVCGGKLNISKNTNTAICDYCGTEFLIKRIKDGFKLESYASCPLCQRNDKSQKLSTISTKFPAPIKPAKPIRKKIYKSIGCITPLIVLGSFLALSNILGGLFSEFSLLGNFFGIVIFILVVLGISTLIGIAIENKLQSSHKRNYEFRLLEEDKRYKKALLEYNGYEKARKKWDKSYYCARDDIVYEIDTKDYSSSNDFYNWLYS